MADPSVAPRPEQTAFDTPSRQCDVVMKGGITSAIAYPPLVLELARTYRFRSIGGTSAAAVSAALTAAAEYGRERGGFEKLKALNEWLADGTHLPGLFQPARATRPLLTLLLAFERRSRRVPAGSGAAGIVTRFWSWFPGWARLVFDVIPGALRDALPLRFWIATALGGVVGGALDVLLARGLVDPGHPLARTVVAIVLPVMFIGCYLASVGACGWRLWRLATVEVPRQGFGICTGLTTSPPSEAPALTDWLHERIQDLSGLSVNGPPLTVGALSAKRGEGNDAGFGIELRMVTTSISLGRSIVLPIEDEQFLFREEDMRRLFPGPVVDHLIATARRTDPARAALAGYLALPRPSDMPVLVLARMSLGFPILLSAVPLYVAPPDGHGRPESEPAGTSPPATTPGGAADGVRRVWFSDGGITSGFPTHSFDAWLPSRPTFGVDLTSQARGEISPRSGGVFIPTAQGRTDPPVRDIVSLSDFLASVWTTAWSFRDNALASVPGYRERIVQIPLAGDEGGLHPAMGPAAVHDVMQKGRTAGELLLDFDFDRHRWVRFLTFMAQFERRLMDMGDAIRSAGYDRLIQEGVRPDFPYYRDAAWRGEALARLALLQAYIASVEARERDRVRDHPSDAGRTFFEFDPPRPEGDLRVPPRG